MLRPLCSQRGRRLRVRPRANPNSAGSLCPVPWSQVKHPSLALSLSLTLTHLLFLFLSLCMQVRWCMPGTRPLSLSLSSKTKVPIPFLSHSQACREGSHSHKLALTSVMNFHRHQGVSSFPLTNYFLPLEV